MPCNFNCRIEPKDFLVTGGRVHCKTGNIFKKLPDRDKIFLLQTTKQSGIKITFRNGTVFDGE